MWHQLRRDGVTGAGGRPIARCTVERLMRELGLRGARGGRRVLPPRADRHTDLVDRDFTAAASSRLWVVDLTCADLVGDGVYRIRLRRVLATDRRMALREHHAVYQQSLAPGSRPRRRAGRFRRVHGARAHQHTLVGSGRGRVVPGHRPTESQPGTHLAKGMPMRRWAACLAPAPGVAIRDAIGGRHRPGRRPEGEP